MLQPVFALSGGWSLVSVWDILWCYIGLCIQRTRGLVTSDTNSRQSQGFVHPVSALSGDFKKKDLETCTLYLRCRDLVAHSIIRLGTQGLGDISLSRTYSKSIVKIQRKWYLHPALCEMGVKPPKIYKLSQFNNKQCVLIEFIFKLHIQVGIPSLLFAVNCIFKKEKRKKKKRPWLSWDFTCCFH